MTTALDTHYPIPIGAAGLGILTTTFPTAAQVQSVLYTSSSPGGTVSVLVDGEPAGPNQPAQEGLVGGFFVPAGSELTFQVVGGNAGDTVLAWVRGQLLEGEGPQWGLYGISPPTPPAVARHYSKLAQGVTAGVLIVAAPLGGLLVVQHLLIEPRNAPAANAAILDQLGVNVLVSDTALGAVPNPMPGGEGGFAFNQDQPITSLFAKVVGAADQWDFHATVRFA